MNDRPHILLVNEFFHPDICASAVVATDHLTKIAALRPDWRITVIAGDRAWDQPDKAYPADDEYRGVKIVRVHRPAVRRSNLLLRGLGFAAFQRSALRGAASLGKIDLVIGTTAPPQGGRIAAKIARRAGCPYIYKVLDLYPDLAATLSRLRPHSFLYRRWLAVDARTMQDAAAVVAISAPITDRIARTRAIPRDKLHTIHDGDDPARLAFTGPNRFREQYNPDGKFVVQYAGNMGLSHPFDTILASARSLAADSDILFQFIGDGPQRAIIAKNLPHNCRLIDYQPGDRLGQILDSADICLISQHEHMFDQALPYKIYAILAAGKPAIFIGSAQSEIAEWLVRGGAGRVVRQGDVAALVTAIRGMRSDPSARGAMGLAARRLFEDGFCSRSAARSWLELIERLLER